MLRNSEIHIQPTRESAPCPILTNCLRRRERLLYGLVCLPVTRNSTGREELLLAKTNQVGHKGSLPQSFRSPTRARWRWKIADRARITIVPFRRGLRARLLVRERGARPVAVGARCTRTASRISTSTDGDQEATLDAVKESTPAGQAMAAGGCW